MPDNLFAYPHNSLIGRLISAAVNNRMLLGLRRAIFSNLPFLKLESDVSDVVYLSWAVPTDRVMPLVPKGISISQRDSRTILTILTYSHKHFGPVLAGPFRRLFPSPLQSNWRLYIDNVLGKRPSSSTVLFIKNIFNHSLYAIGTRLFSDALPSHLALSFRHFREGDGYKTTIEGGVGSAPEFSSTTYRALERSLPPDFAAFFPSWDEAVSGICLQDSAIADVPDVDRVAQADIDLPIQTSEVIPLASSFYLPGSFLQSLGAQSNPFCFCVPKVKFKVLSERLLG